MNYLQKQMDKKLSIIKRIPILSNRMKNIKFFSTIIKNINSKYSVYSNAYKNPNLKEYLKSSKAENSLSNFFCNHLNNFKVSNSKKHFNERSNLVNEKTFLSNNLKKIRSLLKERNYEAYILPRTDSHDVIFNEKSTVNLF
jgi:hypothetical protein